MSYKGRENPTDKDCFRACSACFRCEDKGRYEKCNSCSGRHDPQLNLFDPEDYFDRCRCSEGILQIRLQNGKRIVAKYPGNPYAGEVKLVDEKTQDEVDFDQYVQDTREKLNDPDWSPIRYHDGTSALDY